MKRLLLGVILLPCIAYGSQGNKQDVAVQCTVGDDARLCELELVVRHDDRLVHAGHAVLKAHEQWIKRQEETAGALITQTGNDQRAADERMGRIELRMQGLEWQNRVLKWSLAAVTVGGGVTLYLRTRRG